MEGFGGFESNGYIILVQNVLYLLLSMVVYVNFYRLMAVYFSAQWRKGV